MFPGRLSLASSYPPLIFLSLPVRGDGFQHRPRFQGFCPFEVDDDCLINYSRVCLRERVLVQYTQLVDGLN